MPVPIRLALLLVTSTIVFGSCRAKPLDAIYYGNWVNIYTERYDYETGHTAISTEADILEAGLNRPTVVHLQKHTLYFESTLSRSGDYLKSKEGTWSIDANKSITIQTTDELFYGTIYLLNHELYMEGQQYPLDENLAPIRAKAINFKQKYRAANVEDMEGIEFVEIDLPPVLPTQHRDYSYYR